MRQAQRAGDPVAREMRLLRAGPQRRPVGPRVDDGTGRGHAGMRLERPFIFRRDAPRRTGEGRVDLAYRDRHLALDDGRLTDVAEDRPTFGKGPKPPDSEPLAHLHLQAWAQGFSRRKNDTLGDTGDGLGK